MIHFGIEKLEYKVRFDESCYYPVTLSEDRKHTKLLFGACFGISWFGNSISLSFKPSISSLEKIDLFSYVFSDEIKGNYYVGSLDIKKDYTLKLIFDYYNKSYRIQAFEQSIQNPIINYFKQYKYPSLLMGYTTKKDHGTKVLLEKK